MELIKWSVVDMIYDFVGVIKNKAFGVLVFFIYEDLATLTLYHRACEQ